MDGLDDRLAGVVAGEPAAMAWLYDTYAPVLFRRLRARYGYPGGLDAEELLHDAFVFYLQHDARVIASFLERTAAGARSEALLTGYLWDLACGVASNARRARAARPAEVSVDLSLVPAGDNPAESVLDADLLVRLDACLQNRSARVYLYFKLRYLDGLSPEEITRVTGWSRKATYKLRQTLNDAVLECARSLNLDAG